MSGVPELLRVALASALATALCVRLAPRLGWTDAPRGAETTRKLQRRPVPAVGGLALLAGLACASVPPWGLAPTELWGPLLPAVPWRLASLLLAFAVGTLDDRRPLAPGPKLLAQLVALGPLSLGAGLAHGAAPAALLLVLGLMALNLLNTFDNADGALSGLCALGFALPAPGVTAAALGFLPFNLDAARARNRASGAPSAYLGDAGAFLLGVLVLLVPRAAGLLVLPALDLGRLALVRWRAGSRPWIGDRRHLAHRLEGRGLGRLGVALALWLVALPACALVERGLARAQLLPLALGVATTAALHALALWLAPARRFTV